MRWWLIVLALLLPARAEAFCGFYVAGADSDMFNDATMVVLMRDGTRTVLSMRNDYRGPPEAFALVVPVPEVLQREHVKVLPDDVFRRIDGLSAPRLVEYWEQDPCADYGAFGVGGLGLRGTGFGGGGRTIVTGRNPVRIEAQFEVGEYDIVILSADDAGALERWLDDEGYAIPAGTEPYLRPYVADGSKFFVAKVDPERVTFVDGRARLSPLRFHYDSERFSLPIRLGLINAGESQDLIVHILARDRYDVANYPTATIPTNLDLEEAAKPRFAEFYGALFEKALGPKMDAVVTEYAWSAGTCDPCPSAPLTGAELLTLGADVLGEGGTLKAAPQIRMGRASTSGEGTLDPGVVGRQFRRLRPKLQACIRDHLADEGVVTAALTLTVDPEGKVTKANASRLLPTQKAFGECVARVAQTTSFPAPGAATTVSAPLKVERPALSAEGLARQMVLTRLHARYRPDTLGADYVFEKAEPILGGREMRLGGELEQGAKRSTVNNFQARYAIRHAWTGAIECDDPSRGVWGPRPVGDGPPAPAPAPIAARDLGRRGRSADVSAASFLVDGELPPVARGGAAAPEAAPVVPSPTPPSPPPGADRSPHPAGCRCALVGPSPAPRWWALAFLALALALRRRSAPTG